MKPLFDMFEKLIVWKTNEIHGVKTINWEVFSWETFIIDVMMQKLVSCTRRSTYFQVLCYVLEKWTKTLNKILSGKKNDGSAKNPKVFVENEQKTSTIYRTDHLYVVLQRHLMKISKQLTGIRIKRQRRFYLCEKNSTKKSSSDLDQKKWYFTHENKPWKEWDNVAELMVKFGKSGHPVFRATSPLSRVRGAKLSTHFCADDDTVETIYRNYFC